MLEMNRIYDGNVNDYKIMYAQTFQNRNILPQ